jgi:hypothetical protein
MNDVEFKELIGKTITKINVNEKKDRIEFHCKNEKSIFKNVPLVYLMYHCQDCCESVSIEDINGDLDDLLNTPILQAEERTSRDNPEGFQRDYQDSFTWTFYHLATIKGYVTIRWYGESNGYYSESVDFVEEEYKQ